MTREDVAIIQERRMSQQQQQPQQQQSKLDRQPLSESVMCSKYTVPFNDVTLTGNG
jgi:hypothetical protein